MQKFLLGLVVLLFIINAACLIAGIGHMINIVALVTLAVSGVALFEEIKRERNHHHVN